MLCTWLAKNFLLVENLITERVSPRQFLSSIGSDPRCDWPLLSSERCAELLSLHSTITQPSGKESSNEEASSLVTRENEILIFGPKAS